MITEAKSGNRVYIGRLGENEARQIRFDVSKILAEFQDAELVVLNRRPSDSAAYPVAPAYVEVTSGSLLWTVQSGDLTETGFGECEIRATQGGHILKDEIFQTWIKPALDGSGEAPEPWESWVEQVSDDADRAEAAAQLLENPGAKAETLEPGSQATARYADGVFTFGIPQGGKGDTGPAGKDGKDGQDGAPGADGKDGKNGQDGYTPVRGTDYWTAEDQAEIVSAAAAAAAGEIIDDTAGSGDTNKAWSADKLTTEVGSLLSAINGVQTSKQDAPASGAAAGKVLGLALVDGQLVPVWDGFPVQDVQVNGTSVLNQGVANVPVASASTLGAVCVDNSSNDGIGIWGVSKKLFVINATDSQIKNASSAYNPVIPSKQHRSVFYGLAKAAGDSTQATSNNDVGEYTESAKSAINQMLDAPETVSGSTPSITGKAGIRYICGECTTLSITPPASGDCEVIFVSGSTATVLTVPNTVKFPEWFDATALEANRTYDIIITNATYGVVTSWAS